eukprot:13596418-Alexandrium_andersonii.AAC.1
MAPMFSEERVRPSPPGRTLARASSPRALWPETRSVDIRGLVPATPLRTRASARRISSSAAEVAP